MQVIEEVYMLMQELEEVYTYIQLHIRHICVSDFISLCLNLVDI